MRAVLLAWVILAASGRHNTAQDAASDFIERARLGTARYRDQSVAILDGYRPIGRDFPGMGEHWVRIGLLFDGKIDAERPEFLTYLSVSGKPQLLGVAYALPLLPGELPPADPAGRGAWHDHFRTVEDETILPHHHLPDSMKDASRLAMMHAWIWSPNPAGLFAADNWAIPYLRLGLPVPPDAPISAALALSLLTGGLDYFAASIDASVSPDKSQRAKILAAMNQTKLTVESKVRSGDLTGLTDLWSQLWKSIVQTLSPGDRNRLQTILPK